MARVGAFAGSVVLALLAGAPSFPDAHASQAPLAVRLVADRDDDDLNGVPDGEETFVAPAARVDLVAVDDALVGSTLVPTTGGEHARVLVSGRPLAWGERVPRGAAFQGLTPGTVTLEARRGRQTRAIALTVIGLGFLDGTGRKVDPTRSHASLDREPPSDVAPDHPSEEASRYPATDPLRVLLTTPAEESPVAIDSLGANGAHLDRLSPHGFVSVACADPSLHCFVSAPIRFVIDEVDRRHVLAARRSIRAELGGALVLRLEGLGRKQAIRVLGPRDSAVGPIARLRATIRPFVLRIAPGGLPAIGGSDSGAIAALRAELAAAAAPWGECGVSFGPIDQVDVHVVDPPPPHLLALGNDLGLPASGGRIRFRVDGRRLLELETHPGQLPDEVARAAAAVLERAGFRAVVSPNATIGSGANPSVDVSVRHPDGSLARLERIDLGTPLSTDATLAVAIGAVDLTDGLRHFGDVDSVAGTLEERTLLKALDDGDPSTVEVVIVPFFSGGGRIGESFIGSDRSSLRNVVLLDRAGVRARTSSLTLAHELGHIFLDVPGHPDDYGVDTPTRLMDADASDASPFGPRRLTVSECVRVVHESGPNARSPLLRAWPLAPMVYAKEE